VFSLFCGSRTVASAALAAIPSSMRRSSVA
jgi:hypothetical protein